MTITPFDRRRLHRQDLLQGIKLAGGALAAIALANLSGLKYSATAGIITLLSIQATRRETLSVALGRLLAFGAALLLAAVSYGLAGYTVWGFGVFLFLFALVCHGMGWLYALSPISVLVSHFMAEGAMSPAMLGNEALLFIIGALCGIAVNLTLRADEPRLRRLLHQADEDMRALLRLAAEPCRQEEARAQLQRLDASLGAARTLALANRGNRVFSGSDFDLTYIAMRTRQRDILHQIMAATATVASLPRQHGAVAAFFCRAAEEYRMDNDAARLLSGLEDLLRQMKQDALPASREEFESRAALYYALVRLREFLAVKREFMLLLGKSADA